MSMHSREFWLRRLNLNIGDTVYYVIGEDATYSIKKTRIVGIQKRASGLSIHTIPIDEYLVYKTEDGRIINESFRRKKDELDASVAFLSKDAAIKYVIQCLHCEINVQKHALLNAQQRLEQAERILKLYEKYGK